VTRGMRSWIVTIVIWVLLLGSIALGKTYPALDTIWVVLRLLLLLGFSIFFIIMIFRHRSKGVGFRYGLYGREWLEGGYSDAEVDAAGKQLLETLGPRIQMAMAKNPTPTASCHHDVRTGIFSVSDPKYRASVGGGQMVQVEIVPSPPESGTVARSYHLLLPRNATENDTLLLKNEDDATDTFSVRLSEVTPTLSGMVLARLGSFAERIVREMLAAPKEVAKRSVQDAG